MIRKSEFVTGIFILAALAVLVLVALKSTQDTFLAGNKVTWVAEFDNVALLKMRAKVAASGIEVGQVVGMERVAKDGRLHIRVTMEMESEFAAECRANTKARIKQESFLGDRFVEIVPVLDGPQLVAQGDAITIETEPFSDWGTILSDMKDEVSGPEGVLGKAGTLIDNLNNNFLSPQNADSLANLLNNAQGLIADLRDTVGRINKELDDPNGLLANANRAAREGGDLLAQLNQDYPDIKGNVDRTFEKVQGLLDDGSATLAKIRDILDEADPKLNGILDTTRERLPRLFDQLEHSLAQADTMMQGIDETVRNKDIAGLLYDMRVTMQELTLTIQALRADPSQIIWGGPGVAQPAVPDPKNDLKNIQSGKPKRYGY
ncbi:MAG: MCE family protein [Planctomycetes bacterium]|nr:MCE family protein [Planctomycetota bacterium]